MENNLIRKYIKLIVISFIVGLVVGRCLIHNLYLMNIKERSKAARCLGYQEYKNGDYQRAIVYFSIAIGLNPDWYEPYLSLANSYKMLKYYGLALEAYEKALETNKGKDVVQKGDRDYILKQMNLIRSIISEKSQTMNKGTLLNSAYP